MRPASLRASASVRPGSGEAPGEGSAVGSAPGEGSAVDGSAVGAGAGEAPAAFASFEEGRPSPAPSAVMSAGSTARTTPGRARESSPSTRRRSASTAAGSALSPWASRFISAGEATTGTTTVTRVGLTATPASHTTIVRSRARLCPSSVTDTCTPRGPHSAEPLRGRSLAGTVTAKVVVAPGSIELRPAVITVLSWASPSSASHDSRPLSAISVERWTWTTRSTDSRGSSVPLTIVPEIWRSWPEARTSGARESTDTLTRPSAGGASADGRAAAVGPRGAGRSATGASTRTRQPMMAAMPDRARARTAERCRRNAGIRTSFLTRPPLESRERPPQSDAH